MLLSVAVDVCGDAWVFPGKIRTQFDWLKREGREGEGGEGGVGTREGGG